MMLIHPSDWRNSIEDMITVFSQGWQKDEQGDLWA